MLSQTEVKQKWTLTSVALLEAYTNFVPSRQAMQCSHSTLERYRSCKHLLSHAWLTISRRLVLPAD